MVTPVAVVTGANRGIGLEVARQLVGLGYEVIQTARNVSRIPPIPGAIPHQLDVSSAADAQALAEFVRDRYGHLDVLVNNAAITYDPDKLASAADLTVVRAAAETNLYGPWQLVLALLDLLRASDHPRVVNVSSGVASLATMGGGSPAYATTKVALNA
jgi:NAD(P)-dependent dehydrogenase (short-subunit alcohol dehydrogenase family)